MENESGGGAGRRERAEWLSRRLERALRSAALWHAGQTRKGSEIPYFGHVVAVAMILDRAGFDEDVVIAGLLHDVVEDTPATFEEVAHLFGPIVAASVRACTEIKHDPQGRKRPWIDRKRDQLAALAGADSSARAVVLADKLHNLICIEFDLAEGRPVWSRFNAERAQVLWYYRAMVETCRIADPRVEALALACREVLARIDPEAGGETTGLA